MRIAYLISRSAKVILWINYHSVCALGNFVTKRNNVFGAIRKVAWCFRIRVYIVQS